MAVSSQFGVESCSVVAAPSQGGAKAGPGRALKAEGPASLAGSGQRPLQPPALLGQTCTSGLCSSAALVGPRVEESMFYCTMLAE